MDEAKYPYAVRVGDVEVRTPPLEPLKLWVVHKLGIRDGMIVDVLAKGIGIGIATRVAQGVNYDAVAFEAPEAWPVDK